MKKITIHSNKYTALSIAMLVLLYQLSVGIFLPEVAYASSPVFVNNGTADSGLITPGSTNVVGLNITLPPLDADTFLDSDGTAATVAGTLDSAWDTDGIQTFNSSGTYSDVPNAVAFDSVNNKLYVGGYQDTNGTGIDALILRYNANGSLDSTWDGDGKVIYNYSSGEFTDVKALAWDSANNKLYAAARLGTNVTDFAVFRFNSDGSLDTTWGSTGVVTYNSGSASNYDIPHAILLDAATGKVYVAGEYDGSTSNIDMLILRYNSNGTLDTTWDSDGIVTYNSGTSYDIAYALAFDSVDSDLYVGGRGPLEDATVLRYNSNGALDTGWDTDGIKVYDSGGGNYDQIYALVYDATNTDLYAAGGQQTNGYDGFVLRYNSNGALDTGWDTDGIQTYNSGGTQNDIFQAIQRDSVSGKIYAVGWQATNDADFVVNRYTSAGALDTTWDADGIQTYDAAGTPFDSDLAYAAVLDTTNRRFYVVGQQNTNGIDFGVLRYFTHNDGAPSAITNGDTLVAIGANTLCGDTDGTTAPTKIRTDANTDCATIDGSVVLGEDTTGTTFNLGASTSQVLFRDSVSVNGTWDSGEDIYFDADDSLLYNADTVDAITVRNLGSAVDATDIYIVKWWVDNGDGQFSSATDAIVDSLCPWDSANDWECGDNTSLSYAGSPGTTSRIYITYDLTGSSTATTGQTIQLQVAAFSDSGTAGAFNSGDTGIFFSNAGTANTGNHDGPTAVITNDSTRTIGSASSSSSPTQNGVPIVGGVPLEPLVTNTETETITDETGGSVTETAANDGSSATVSVEEGTTSGDAVFTVATYVASEVFTQNPLPSGLDIGGKAVYDITATVGGQSLDTFVKPLTLTFAYQENNLSAGVSENDLRLAVFGETESNWYVLEDAVVDVATNTVTYQSNHLTRFALVRPADSSPPAQPANVSVAAISNGVRISWQNPALDFHHARILRAASATETGSLLATNLIGTSYDDTSISSSEVYYYKVFSIDYAGNMSSPAAVSFGVSSTQSQSPPEGQVSPESSGVADGDLIRALNTVEVYVTKKIGATVIVRHIVNPRIFDVYGHFGGSAAWNKIVPVESLGNARISAWVRGSDGRVWEVNGDATRHWMNMTWQQFASRVAAGDSALATSLIFEVNDNELALYAVSSDVRP